MRTELTLGLSGPDTQEIARWAQGLELASSGLPSCVFVDDRKKKVTSDWFERWLPRARRDFTAEFGLDEKTGIVDGMLAVSIDRMVKVIRRDAELDPERVLRLLEDAPFVLCSMSKAYPEWQNGALGEDYIGPSFAELHWSHGWACAFKGVGHDRLVSRRWLDHGPWRVLRGANDTTLVQFHDLAMGPAEALAVARVAHERMGISGTGGFLQTGYSLTYEINGLYLPEERRLRIIVHGREVTQREMRDACASRHYQVLGEDRPLDHVAYVFADPDEARAHLHELWLRELECWTFDAGREVRLDEHYAPTPNKPDWVKRLDG